MVCFSPVVRTFPIPKSSHMALSTGTESDMSRMVYAPILSFSTPFAVPWASFISLGCTKNKHILFCVLYRFLHQKRLKKHEI
jgi:hypothetical protein